MYDEKMRIPPPPPPLGDQPAHPRCLIRGFIILSLESKIAELDRQKTNKQDSSWSYSLGLTWLETPTCADPEGATGVRTPPPPLENHKDIGFYSNTGQDPLKITKLPSQHSMLGHDRHASETPFKWRFAGEPMMAR